MLKIKIKNSLLNLPRFVKRGVVAFFDFLLCGVTVWFALGLKLDYWGIIQGSQWWALIASLGFLYPLFFYFGLYRSIFRYVGSTALPLARAFVIYTTLFFFMFSLIGVDGIPRSIGVIQPILLFIGVISSRYFIRYWLGGINTVKNSPHHLRPVALIYGAGAAGRQLAAGLSITKEMPLKGFIDDDRLLQGSVINGVNVYPSTDLQNLISGLGVTDILLAIPSANSTRRNEIIASLSGRGVRVRTVPGLADLVAGRVRISDLHDLDINDLLGRKAVQPDIALLEKNLRNKTVLITGAGGSIGSELCRQIIKFSPASLILIDISEHALYTVNEDLKKLIADQENLHTEFLEGNNINPIPAKFSRIRLITCLASVRDKATIKMIFNHHRPDTVFHAAAYKHVPLVEENPVEGICNNVFGTKTCAEVSSETGVANFILISTDKAVRPTNIMGASKRIAEMILQAIADHAKMNGFATKFSMVRFGNVLGSSGSVVPLFNAQIKAGGPITLTHPEVTRYFMTIPEAAQLVIQSCAMARGGDVFVLDMGQPVRIYDLAAKMVYLSGLMVKDELNTHGDIQIKVTGLRPGEKLYEELLIGNNPQATEHLKIMKANEEFLALDELELRLEELRLSLHTNDIVSIRSALKMLVSDYQYTSDTNGWIGA